MTDAATDDDWSGDDLEAAYQRALDALEAVNTEITASSEVAAAITGQPLTAADAPPALAAEPAPDTDDQVLVNARQVLEACLFVGGLPLTAAKLASLLKGDYTPQFVETTLDELNRLYAVQGRPYEIRLGEGGYRLTLRDEYERIRNKVYGLGPKEVRLSQESLEVLAVVAYRQPLSEAELSELGRPQAGGLLRQLLRRDLIAVHRDAEQPKVVRYVTTPRFLSLFGIGSLDDLPRPDELSYK